jgi:hypothetical protein
LDQNLVKNMAELFKKNRSWYKCRKLSKLRGLIIGWFSDWYHNNFSFFIFFIIFILA